MTPERCDLLAADAEPAECPWRDLPARCSCARAACPAPASDGRMVLYALTDCSSAALCAITDAALR